MKFIATGDTIVTCPYTRDYKGYKELAKYIRSFDVRMNNMENPLVDGPCETSAFSGIPWMAAPTSLLDEMADFDFNCYGFANNHALDYFYTGLESTLQAFETRSLPVAGAGRSLDEATRHIKINTDKGSFALVALTGTCDFSAPASNARGNLKARPGVSLLRFGTRFFITEEQLEALKQIADKTKVNGRDNNARKLGSQIATEGEFPFGPLRFAVGDGSKLTYPDEYDMIRYEKAVKAAVADADRVAVYVHSHEIKGDQEMEPDYYLETFARACIDWGADTVICSGTHQIKAVEIYNGKPIYYSIANFFFRPYDMAYYPEEWYEKYKIDKSLSVKEAENIRSKNGAIGLFTQAYCFRCIAPVVEWDDAGNAVKIAALPLSLGFHDSMESKGFPRIAEGEDVDALLRQLENVCEPYGTKVEFKDGLFEFSKK